MAGLRGTLTLEGDEAMEKPPTLTVPERLPWQDVKLIHQRLEEIVGLLQAMTAAPRGVPAVARPPAVDGRLDALVTSLNTLASALTGRPPTAPPVQLAVDGRLDALTLGMPLHKGKATGGSSNSLIQRGQFWETNIWRGFELLVIEGTGAGQNRTVRSNTRDALTVDAWDVIPDQTSVFVIRAERRREKVDEAVATGETTDAFTNALDWDTRWWLGAKTIVLENTDGTNSLDYRTLVRAHYADGGDAVRFATQTLAAGDSAIILLSRPYARVKVEVRSATAGNPANYRISRVTAV